jgi:hypothetical protein
MADINIQKKDKPVWPWVLGILAVLALVFFLFRNNDGDDRRQAATTTTTRDTVDRTATGAGIGAGTAAGTERGTVAREEELPGSVEDFVLYVRETDARQEADLNHDYTADGIRHLARALDDLADHANVNGADFNTRKERLKEKADALQRDPHSLQHANIIRDAFTSAADVMESIQREAYPNHNNHVNQVRQAANNINPQQQTLNQKQQIEAFFERSSNALQAMGTAPHHADQGTMNRRN